MLAHSFDTKGFLVCLETFSTSKKRLASLVRGERLSSIEGTGLNQGKQGSGSSLVSLLVQCSGQSRWHAIDIVVAVRADDMASIKGGCHGCGQTNSRTSQLFNSFCSLCCSAVGGVNGGLELNKVKDGA